MSKITIEYDENEGTFKADGDLKVELPFLPVLKSSTKEAAEITEDLVDLGTSSFKNMVEPVENILNK